MQTAHMFFARISIAIATFYLYASELAHKFKVIQGHR